MWSSLQKVPYLQKMRSIDLRNPLTQEFLLSYRSWWHEVAVTKKEWQRVQEIVIDGHQKVAAKCIGNPPAHTGRPRKDREPPSRQNGWFMAVDPKSSLVLAVTNMENPENNAVAKKIVIQAVSKAPHINCIIYDRMCACYQQLGRETALKKIKFWCVLVVPVLLWFIEGLIVAWSMSTRPQPNRLSHGSATTLRCSTPRQRLPTSSTFLSMSRGTTT